jgi:hypothetical protein
VSKLQNKSDKIQNAIKALEQDDEIDPEEAAMIEETIREEQKEQGHGGLGHFGHTNHVIGAEHPDADKDDKEWGEDVAEKDEDDDKDDKDLGEDVAEKDEDDDDKDSEADADAGEASSKSGLFWQRRLQQLKAKRQLSLKKKRERRRLEKQEKSHERRNPDGTRIVKDKDQAQVI